MNNRITPLHKQSGVVLVVSLIMLLLLTLIGLTGSQVTGMEEKMASNSRDQNLAFQSAEAALRAGEARIQSIVTLAAFNGANGLLGTNNASPVFNSAATWINANSFVLATGGNALPTEVALGGIQTQPRYFIKRLSTGPDNSGGSINVGGYGSSTAGGAISYFTVTSRGTGGQDSSQIYLRSYFGKRF